MKHSLTSLCIGAATALLTCTAVQAQQAGFTGTALAIGLAATRDHVDYGGTLSGNSSKENDVVGKLDLSYGVNVAPQWVTTVGATYDVNKTDFGSVGYVNNGTAYNIQGKLKDHFSLYVAPGYRFTPTSLGYVKLGWHTAKGEFSDGQGGSGSTTENGVGYGLGLSAAVAAHVETRFEIERVDFDRKSVGSASGKPDITQALFSVGYRF